MSGYLFALAFPDAAAQARRLSGFRDLIAAQPGRSLATIVGNTASCPQNGQLRFGCVAADASELRRSIDAFLAEGRGKQVFSGAGGKPRLVWLFPGHGAWRFGAGDELMREPAFRAVREECDAAFTAQLGASPLEFAAAGAPADGKLAPTVALQALSFTLQVSLAALWRSWGIEPGAVIGHSSGEVAAAHVAGALSLADGVRIICERSALLNDAAGKGGMASIALTSRDAELRIAGRATLGIAAINGSASTVVSGDADDLRSLIETLKAEGISSTWLAETAAHSPQMDAPARSLAAQLAGLTPWAGTATFYSTVTGTSQSGRTLDASYWARNLRQPVRFYNALAAASSDGFDVALEIGASPTLSFVIEEGGRRGEFTGIAAIPSLRQKRSERHTMLLAAAKLHSLGLDLDLREMCAAPGESDRQFAAVD